MVRVPSGFNRRGVCGESPGDPSVHKVRADRAEKDKELQAQGEVRAHEASGLGVNRVARGSGVGLESSGGGRFVEGLRILEGGRGRWTFGERARLWARVLFRIRGRARGDRDEPLPGATEASVENKS